MLFFFLIWKLAENIKMHIKKIKMQLARKYYIIIKKPWLIFWNWNLIIL